MQAIGSSTQQVKDQSDGVCIHVRSVTSSYTVLTVLIAESCLRLYQKQCERPLGALRRLKNFC